MKTKELELAINPEPHVFIPDHNELNDPEILAMLQSMYSRSDMPIEARLADLADGDADTKQKRIKAAIKTYYLDYGHASIADCANVPVFIEGVSMLAAKAMQDNPLYNGQERSTRYQDFSKVPFYAESEFSKDAVEKWRELYVAYLPKIEAWVKAAYKDKRDRIMPDDNTPSGASASFGGDQMSALLAYDKKREALWNKTCKAISFDIARGLLPCGATTSLSMYMSLRQYRDHLTQLSTHPLLEVRKLAIYINDLLFARYPNTFKPIRKISDTPAREFYMTRKVYGSTSYANVRDVVNLGGSGQYLANDDDNTWYGIQGCIDFGSYRDLQRHRNGKNQMPLVNARAGAINHFYHKILKAVDFDLFRKALDIYDQLVVLTNFQSGSVFELQYAHPMMTQVPTGMFWSKSQLKYVLALRTKTSVHPTLREWCHSLHKSITAKEQLDFPVDMREDYVQSNRGDQDLKQREIGASK